MMSKKKIGMRFGYADPFCADSQRNWRSMKRSADVIKKMTTKRKYSL